MKDNSPNKVLLFIIFFEMIFKKVLFIGPKYRDHRGGIGAVLETYAITIPKIKFIPTYNNERVVSLMLCFISAIMRQIWVLSFDKEVKVVHLHSASNGSFLRKSILVLISKIFIKKVVFHIHGGGFKAFYNKSPFLKRYISFILKRCDLIICLSKQWEVFFSTIVDYNKIKVIYNPVEAPEKVYKRKLKDKVQFLFLGKVCESKGIYDLLKSISQLDVKVKKRIKLVIAGNGEENKLKAEIMRLDIVCCTEFVGWISGEDKKILLNNSDVFVLPSYVEGLPVSILEAMTYGLPIISSPVGGIPEIVRHNHNGLLVKPGDHISLSKAIEFFVHNNDSLKEYGNQSFEIVKPYLSNAVMHSLHETYFMLLNKES